MLSYVIVNVQLHYEYMPGKISKDVPEYDINCLENSWTKHCAETMWMKFHPNTYEMYVCNMDEIPANNVNENVYEW